MYKSLMYMCIAKATHSQQDIRGISRKLSVEEKEGVRYIEPRHDVIYSVRVLPMGSRCQDLLRVIDPDLSLDWFRLIVRCRNVRKWPPLIREQSRTRLGSILNRSLMGRDIFG